MATCAECGDGIETTYDCHDCGDGFCVDCRLPGDHDCAPATGPDAASDGGAATVDSSSVSLPKPPRVTVLLPVWRAIPWQLHVLVAILLAPVSAIVLAQHVYHERVADAIAAEDRTEADLDGNDDVADDQSRGDGATSTWTPSWVYYVPAGFFGVTVLVGNLQFVAVLGGLVGVIGTLVYAVQKWRHG